METTIKHRRGTRSGWAQFDPVLAEGEFGVEIDTGRFKMGDGSTAWNALPYFTPGDGGGGPVVPPAGPVNLDDLADVDVSAAQPGHTLVLRADHKWVPRPLQQALYQLSDVHTDAETPAGKILGTTAEGRWEPVDPPDVDPDVLADLRTDIDLNAEKIGDTSLLDFGVPEHDLVHYLIKLEARIVALEGTEIPQSEGFLEVDNYSNGFIRVRDTSGILDDGLVHSVTLKLATVPGPGGVVITDPPGVPAGTAGTWYDSGGNLGAIVGATGTNVNQTTIRNWVKYGDPTKPGYYLLWVRVDTTTEPAHPRLVVEKVASVT